MGQKNKRPPVRREYKTLSKDALRQELRSRGIKSSGKKSDMVSRLSRAGFVMHVCLYGLCTVDISHVKAGASCIIPLRFLLCVCKLAISNDFFM